MNQGNIFMKSLSGQLLEDGMLLNHKNHHCILLEISEILLNIVRTCTPDMRISEQSYWRPSTLYLRSLITILFSLQLRHGNIIDNFVGSLLISDTYNIFERSLGY